MTQQGANVEIPATIISEKKVIEFVHIWTIKNFNFFLRDKVIRSPTFGSDAADGIQWCLELHPEGVSTKHEKFVSVYLTLLSTPENPVYASHRIHLLDAEGKTTSTASGVKPDRYAAPDDGWGRRRFIALKDLLNAENRYFPDNQLTLLCKVCYSVESENARRSIANYDLPSLGIEKFNGDSTTFVTWWSDFRVTVHEREDLTIGEKLAYLRNLITGDAANCIKGGAPPDADYVESLDNLLIRYGNIETLPTKLIRELLQKPKPLRIADNKLVMCFLEMSGDPVAPLESPKQEGVGEDEAHQEADAEGLNGAIPVSVMGSTSRHELRSSENLPKEDADYRSDVGDIDGNNSSRTSPANATQPEHTEALRSETGMGSLKTSCHFCEESESSLRERMGRLSRIGLCEKCESYIQCRPCKGDYHGMLGANSSGISIDSSSDRE